MHNTVRYGLACRDKELETYALVYVALKHAYLNFITKFMQHLFNAFFSCHVYTS